jgi:hypothetical protein
MSEEHPTVDLLDPTGMLRRMHDLGFDSWAKTMTQMVNSDSYAAATAATLDAWLSSSAPFRKAMETGVAQSLSALNLPSRDDVARIAQQLTNIEMRLDDMEAKIDQFVPPEDVD